MSAEPRPPAATFHLDRVARTEHLGLQEPVWVTLLPDGLFLQDSEGGQALIEPKQVQRLRTGRLTLKNAHDFETRIWIGDATSAVILTVHEQELVPYKHAIGGFATMVAAEGGLRRLERGTSVLDALLTPLVAGAPAVVVSGIISFAAFAHLPWWQRLAVPSAIVVVGALIAWLWRRGRPRPVRDIDDYLDVMRLPRLWPKPPADPASR